MNALGNLKGFPTPKKAAFACASGTTVALAIMMFQKDGTTSYHTGTVLPTGVTMFNFITANYQWLDNFDYWVPMTCDGDVYLNFTAGETSIGVLPTSSHFIIHEGAYNGDAFKPIGKSYQAECNGAVSNSVLRLFGASSMTELDPYSQFNREVSIANLSATLQLRVKEIAAGATLTGLVSTSIWDYSIDVRDWTNPPIFVPAGRDLAIVRDSSSSDVVYAQCRMIH